MYYAVVLLLTSCIFGDFEDNASLVARLKASRKQNTSQKSSSGDSGVSPKSIANDRDVDGSSQSGILSAELYGDIEKNPNCIRKTKNDYIFFKVKLKLTNANIDNKPRVILDSSYGEAKYCLAPQSENSKIALKGCKPVGRSLGSSINYGKEDVQKDNTIVVYFFYLRKGYKGDTIKFIFKDWNGVKRPVLTINLNGF